ncbi:ABC transporter permease [Nocardioides caeni]|uniref:ABC transporter permease subunit n=1 Tax=Nocardioides caeni TaxID=574700 RepID=A0A4S8N784_9ACTN|nr:ABC transporter permease subunit [Nocardioides caeni]THV10534.1 ABC transporter permease subunit [Nocardioides caeni]
MTSLAETGATDARARLPIGEVRWSTVLAPLALGVVVIGLWQLAVDALEIEPFVLPSPGAIAGEIGANIDSVVSGARATGRNALLGLVIGGVVGVAGALLAGTFRVVDELAANVVAAAAVVPIVALAPVLYSMFGAAVDTGRIIVAALSVAVPVYLNTLRGLREVLPVHRDLMAAYAAGRWQVAREITLPTATPYVFTGLRVGSSLAVIAALIAEYFGGPIGGLGKSITSSAASSNYPLAWAYVTGAIVLGLLFYVATLTVEQWLSRHHHP